MKFIILDIETANFEPTSICQLGVVVMENFKITHRIEYLIRPYPFEFISKFTKMHDITAEMVADAPTFDIVWDNIKHLFDDFTLCFAHNASFDFGYIKAALNYYNCETENLNFPILCTLQYSKRSNIEPNKFTLADLCEYFGIKNERSHTALSDAVATSEVLLRLIEINSDNLVNLIANSYLYSFKEVSNNISKRKRYNNIKDKDIEPTKTTFDESHALYGKTVVITGELQFMTRSDAYLAIKNVGGLCGDNITKRTDYLVTNSNNMTGKMKKAIEYIEKGQNIEIINESQLYELLK